MEEGTHGLSPRNGLAGVHHQADVHKPKHIKSRQYPEYAPSIEATKRDVSRTAIFRHQQPGDKVTAQRKEDCDAYGAGQSAGKAEVIDNDQKGCNGADHIEHWHSCGLHLFL